MKNFLAWLMRSRLARIGLAALLGLVRLFGPLSGGVIALVTLRHGWIEGLLTTLGASVVLGAVEAGVVHGGLYVLTLPTLILWWVIIGLALVLRRNASLALMVQIATALGCLAVGLFFLVNPHPETFWIPLLKQALLPMLEPAQRTAPNVTLFIQGEAMRMTGVVGASLAFGSSLAVLCGRWGQALLYNPGGFRAAFHRLRVGWVATLLASVVYVLAALFNNALVENLAIVLLVMFMYQGLAVIHNVASLKNIHVGWLAAFYVLFVVAFLYVLAVVAGLGLIDNWFDIRARVARQR